MGHFTISSMISSPWICWFDLRCPTFGGDQPCFLGKGCVYDICILYVAFSLSLYIYIVHIHHIYINKHIYIYNMRIYYTHTYIYIYISCIIHIHTHTHLYNQNLEIILVNSDCVVFYRLNWDDDPNWLVFFRWTYPQAHREKPMRSEQGILIAIFVVGGCWWLLVTVGGCW